MLAIAEQLRPVYREVCGRTYPHPTPVFESPPEQGPRLDFLRETHNARHWLGVALSAAGSDPHEADKWFTHSCQSQAVDVVKELRGFDETGTSFLLPRRSAARITRLTFMRSKTIPT
jgi:hypothetical protein